MDSRLTLSIALTAIFFGCLVHSQTCFEDGRCDTDAGSIRVYYNYNNDSNACLQSCKDYNANMRESLPCNFFYVNYDKDQCNLYFNCTLTSSGCNDCIVGEKPCEPLQCDRMGTCSRSTLLSHLSNTTNINDCINECENTLFCSDISYNTQKNVCLLFDGCNSLSFANDAANFVSAQKKCRF